MEVEKKSCTGGFLSFFDWGGNSRKDGIKKVNESIDELVSRFRLRICEVTNTLSAESYNQAECEVDSLKSSSWKLAASYNCLLNYPPMAGWESLYLRDVISHAELRVNHYLLGQVDDVIDPNLLDQLENQPQLIR